MKVISPNLKSPLFKTYKLTLTKANPFDYFWLISTIYIKNIYLSNIQLDENSINDFIINLDIEGEKIPKNIITYNIFKIILESENPKEKGKKIIFECNFWGQLTQVILI